MKHTFKMMLAALVLLVSCGMQARSVADAAVQNPRHGVFTEAVITQKGAFIEREGTTNITVSYDLVNIDSNRDVALMKDELLEIKKLYPNAVKMSRDYAKIGDTFKHVGDAFVDASGTPLNYQLKY